MAAWAISKWITLIVPASEYFHGLYAYIMFDIWKHLSIPISYW